MSALSAQASNSKDSNIRKRRKADVKIIYHCDSNPDNDVEIPIKIPRIEGKKSDPEADTDEITVNIPHKIKDDYEVLIRKLKHPVEEREPVLKSVVQDRLDVKNIISSILEEPYAQKFLKFEDIKKSLQNELIDTVGYITVINKVEECRFKDGKVKDKRQILLEDNQNNKKIVIFWGNPGELPNPAKDFKYSINDVLIIQNVKVIESNRKLCLSIQSGITEITVKNDVNEFYNTSDSDLNVSN